MLIGIDTGGTFTDFVVIDDQGLRVHKVLSTPEAPERAILQGIRELGLDIGRYRLIHGSTVATNAVLEGKGVRTAYITNRGLADVLTIGRQNRRALYDLQPVPPPPPVPPEYCLETGGRIAADGSPVEPLTAEDLDRLQQQLAGLDVRAVAINLLFSWLDDRAEQAIEAALPEGLFVSRSSRVLPEYREYERGMATFLNAYVGPLVQGYLRRLERDVAPAPVAVMQSSGETASAAQAGELAVHLLLSGPAGGLMGARHIGEQAGCGRLLTFDMGGTSTDVALIDGRPRLTTESSIGPYPVAVPMVDMHTIGAGGGSIASIDAGGLLQVGPESAGARPGPACYGGGGQQPTVTDAHVLLGRLPVSARLGGALSLDPAAARQAFEPLARALSLSVEQAAAGVIALANEHMARALRVISVNRGENPREYVLACFGGAGGLHVCELAEALGMQRALVPRHAGVLSAFGMLVTPPGRQLSRTWLVRYDELDEQRLQTVLAELEQAGRNALAAEGVKSGLASEYRLELRYQGQSFTLAVAWRDKATTLEDFHRLHEQRYGHRLAMPVELVTVRVAVRAEQPAVVLEEPPVSATGIPAARVRVHGVSDPVAVWLRADLAAGQQLEGPAIVTEAVATTWIAPGWRAQEDSFGNLLLTRRPRISCSECRENH